MDAVASRFTSSAGLHSRASRAQCQHRFLTNGTDWDQAIGPGRSAIGQNAPIYAASQQVQYVNVGVTLQIAPRVSSDGYVSSHVFCVVSSVTGTSQGYPTISQREAETSATVRDGDSFVIGGLTQEDFISTKGKIPGLGDIPLLGNLFHNDRRTSAKTELYIVVTPHIVRRVGLNSPAANAPPPGNGVQY